MKKLLMFLCLILASPVWATDIPDPNSTQAQLYSERCSACHRLPHPARLDWQHWRSMLRMMKQRMDERGMDMPDEEWREVAGYLKSHAR